MGKPNTKPQLQFIEVLMDLIGDHPQDPRWGLLEIATKAVDVYEAQNYPELDELSEQHHSSVAVLRVLMDQYRLGKSDFLKSETSKQLKRSWREKGYDNRTSQSIEHQI